MSKGTVVVISAGDATGGAIAHRFAREGYEIAVTRRPATSVTWRP
jgi:NAD(P)-dependent dehydrogenase (short-subunit alcohol dehydrogenase family)